MLSLSAQYEDLKTAEASWKNIIQELDEGMRKQFTGEIPGISRESLTRLSRNCLEAVRDSGA